MPHEPAHGARERIHGSVLGVPYPGAPRFVAACLAAAALACGVSDAGRHSPPDSDAAELDALTVDASDDVRPPDSGEVRSGPDQDVPTADAEPSDDGCDLGGRALADGPIPSCDAFPTPELWPAGDGPMLESAAFDDIGYSAGLPMFYGVATSAGDVNGDGTPDIFAAGVACEDRFPRAAPPRHNSELFLNCGGRLHAVGLRARAGRPTALDERAFTSHVADLDRDGLVDLVLGTRSGIHVLFQNPDGTFDFRTAWTRTDAYTGHAYPEIRSLAVFDFDNDGLLDIYGALYGGENPLVLSRADRGFVDATFDHPEFAAAGNVETYANAVILLPDMGPFVYIGNHARLDAIYRLRGGPRFLRVLDDYEPWATMGVDYDHPGDGLDPIIVTSDDGPLFAASFNGSILRPMTDRLRMRTGYTWWGLRFGDFDNDGVIDLAVVSGRPEADPEWETGRHTDNRIFLLDGTGDAEGTWWVDRSEQAGLAFDGSQIRDYYALSTLDFDSDGCLDLLATPIDRASFRLEELQFSTPVRLLRNRCRYAGGWIGFLVDGDPGAQVTVSLQSPTGPREVIGVSKPAAGIGSQGPLTQIHMGAGNATAASRIVVTCRDGRTTEVPPEQVALGRYNDLRGVCAPL